MRRRIRIGTALVVASIFGAPVPAQMIPAGWMEARAPERGTLEVPGLSAPATIERDAAGRPTVVAATWLDAVRALGVLHGHERFTHMDMARRRYGGRLAELIGPFAVAIDRTARSTGLGLAAQMIYDNLNDEERALLEIYAEGVNAGLATLGGPPAEHALLGVEPAPWTPVDSCIVYLAFFDGLHDNARREPQRGVLREALPPELYAALTTTRSRFEAPLLAGPDEDVPLALPGPDVIDFRAMREMDAPAGAPLSMAEPPAAGSNNWAVAGARTGDGRALLASDPHLPIMMPGIWYRCAMVYGDGAERTHLDGVTLPGLPGVIIGSNGHVAWGFTNTSADFQDLVIVEVDPDDPDRYRVPGGWERFEDINERIEVRGMDAQSTVIRMTRWGPLHDTDPQGRPRALRWTVFEPGWVDFGILRMRDARTVETALDVLGAWRGPSQNALVADRTGRIGWTLSGVFPKRRGFDGSVPMSWASGDVGWDGMLDERWRPRIVDPASGVLYTANNRTLPVRWAARLGDGWDLGARAYRIQQRLDAMETVSEADLFALQLDTRLIAFDWYRDLFLDAMAGAGRLGPEARASVAAVRAWNGTADIDAVGLPILERFRSAIGGRLLQLLTAECRRVDPGFGIGMGRRYEELVRRIVETRPAHLLPPGASDWSAWLSGTALEVARRQGSIAERTWGDVHRLSMTHPLSMVNPQLRQILDGPDAPLAGHPLAVRVASPEFSASLRLVVSPGDEALGILHMPAGGSGHPLAPTYRGETQAWLNGAPVPLRHGATATRLELVPEG